MDKVIDGVLSRRIDLPSGGYLIIDYAEALTVIDVNSGSFTGKGRQARLEDTITKTNLEAADEVVRQLRLRDIGGIIVIDFIDMARARNRDAVLKTLRKALDEDRTKTYTAEISPLGLVEMTRQNVTEGVREIMTRTCPTCDGEGVIKSEETIAIELERRLRELAKRAPKRRGLPRPGQPARQRRSSPATAARVLHALEEETGKLFHFEGSEGLPLDHFDVVTGGRARRGRGAGAAVPRGDEVLVHIVEPHMYNVGRRRRQDRRLHHLGGRRRRRTSARSAWCASRRSGRTAADARVLVEPRRRTAADERSTNPHLPGAVAAEADGAVPVPRPRPPSRIGVTMYAIVKTGGKQYRVEQGQSLLVERLPRGRGRERRARAAALPLDDETSSTATAWEGQGRGQGRRPRARREAARVKFKPKRGYKRRTGHRQELTRIEVTEIKLRPARRQAAAAKTEEEGTEDGA